MILTSEKLQGSGKTNFCSGYGKCEMELDDLIQEYGKPMALKVAVHAEHTTHEQIETYVAAVWFLAWWMEKQDGAGGYTTEQLFDHLKQNVCTVMAEGAEVQ